ncbi:MAG: hypothetical protein JNL36_07115 [Candidatus Kapabacteria bacterium]|nr:hypothetical protein [Candidatus Kapabacteria bacterium]
MEQQEIPSFTLVSVFKKYKKLLFLITSSSTIITLLISFAIPYRYESDALLLPPETSSMSGGLSSLLKASPLGSLELPGMGKNSVSENYMVILKSKTLSSKIIDSLKLLNYPLFKGATKQEAVAMLTDLFTITVTKSGSITVNFELSTGTFFSSSEEKKYTAELASKIVNLALHYLDVLNREKSNSSAKRSRVFIDKMIEENKDSLEILQRKFQDFREKNKAFSLEEQLGAIVTSAVDIGSALAAAEVELKLALLEYSPEAPNVVLLRKKVETLKTQYKNVQEKGIVGSDNFSIPLTQVPEISRVFLGLTRDIKILESINAFLITQRFQEYIQETKDITTIQVLDYAEPVYLKVAPKRPAMVVVAFVTSLILSIFGLMLYETLKKASTQTE